MIFCRRSTNANATAYDATPKTTEVTPNPTWPIPERIATHTAPPMPTVITAAVWTISKGSTLRPM